MKTDQWLLAFAKLDRNHDNQISRSEIDESVIDSNLTPELSALTAALKAHFKEVTNLHRDGWIFNNKSITLADMLVFEEILNQHAKDPVIAQGDWEQTVYHSHKQALSVEMLAALSSSIITRVEKLGATTLSLYANIDDPIKSIRPEAPRQGIVGDCFFLAGLSSLAAINPRIILHSIKQNGDDTFTVTFPGAPGQPITVNSPTIVELALYARATEFGIWPAVMEKAYGVYLAQYIPKKCIIPAENTEAAEHMHQVFDLLTGQMGQYLVLSDKSKEDVIAALSEAFREGRIVGTVRHSKHANYAGDGGIPSRHAYSVIGWNAKTAVVTLRNPWGHTGISKANKSLLTMSDDGIFTMDIGHYCSNFDYMFYEEWIPRDDMT